MKRGNDRTDTGWPVVDARILIACMLLAGCSGNMSPQLPAVEFASPTGVTPIYTPGPVMPGGQAPPPPGLEAPPLASPPPVAQRSGDYQGTATPLDSGGGACINTIRIEGFHVRGNAVRFGEYYGTIDASGGLQMALRGSWIIGQFEGASFHGQYDPPGAFGGGCSFTMALQRVGS
jgi:hypothetical protein